MSSSSGEIEPDPRRLFGAAALLWLVAVALAEIAGFDATIPWTHFQILDRVVLRDHPFGALWMLHQQPPVLNALLALCLRVGDWLHVAPEHVLQSVYLALGLAAVLLFTDLVLRVTRSRGLALFGALAMVADPSFHYFSHLGWYPFLVRTEVVLSAWSFVRALQTAKRSHVALALAAFLSLVLTRTLFHPLWPLGAAALLLVALRVLHGPRAGAPRRYAPLAAAFVGLMALWPLKNQAVFGVFTYSTITGVNLARVTTLGRTTWAEYFNHGVVPPEVEAKVESYRERYGDELAYLVGSPEKHDGSRNWNHLILLEESPKLAREGIRWRLENPSTWAFVAAMQYLMWARPAIEQPYRGDLLGPPSPVYQAYASAYRALLFTNVRPWIERATPSLDLHRRMVLKATGEPLRYTLFGLLWFPAIALASTVGCFGRGRMRSIEGWTTLFALYAGSWTLVVPVLTDGIEANRMRFSTSALFTLLVLLLAARAGRWLRARRAAA